jgi:hypothetical protein
MLPSRPSATALRISHCLFCERNALRTALSTLSEVQSKANSELSLLKWFAEDNQSEL